MQLDLTDEETRALLNLLMETIENDRYPFSPRIQLLQQILAKFGEMGPKPPPPPELLSKGRGRDPSKKRPPGATTARGRSFIAGLIREIVSLSGDGPTVATVGKSPAPRQPLF